MDIDDYPVTGSHVLEGENYPLASLPQLDQFRSSGKASETMGHSAA